MKKEIGFLPVLLAISLGSLFVVAASSTCRGDEKTVTKSVTKTATSSSSVNIGVDQNNDEAKVKYNGKEVWKGKVKKPVITVAKSVDGKDLAAAFEGKKLLWENVAGAGAKLENERKKAAKRLKNPGA